MVLSLIRGKYIICQALSHTEVELIEDGAIAQQDGKIIEIGNYADLAQKYEVDQVIGSANHIVLPGFVNSHHHIGLSSFQLGSPDAPLELWLANRIAHRHIDPYLDTLYSALLMIESGITTVQHIHRLPGRDTAKWEAIAHQILQAYQDVGMRVSYCFMIRDQNHLVYGDDTAFIEQLPVHLRADTQHLIDSQTVPLQDYMDFFVHLWSSWNGNTGDRVKIQLAPANLHWCSDKALLAQKEYADKYQVKLHMHLLETPYQKEYAKRRFGTTAVNYLHQMGFLNPNLTLGHGTWMTEEDIDLIADARVMICHNASSNLRFQSGIAPLNRFVEAGIKVAIGLDESGINEDQDILQEMRLVLNLHRVPGHDQRVPQAAQVFQMGTAHGAETTGFGKTIGHIAPGTAADLVVLDGDAIAFPYLDGNISVIDAIVHRARTSSIKTVMIGGEVVFDSGTFTRIDKQAVFQELANSLQVPLTPQEEYQAQLSKQLFPYIKQFYQNWLSASDCHPYYCHNSCH
jgi:5-methylthioadenosine/S-adenosylhomocysteine deaminase